MAKRRQEIDSDSTNAEATSFNTVFVDTSLDTHLVMIISDDDTVSDFKEKIRLQHSESFPRIGEIRIHSLQVKRRGHFYHLPDSMLMSSAFDASKKTWFLFVEASCSEEKENDKEQLSCNPDAIGNVSLLSLQNHSQAESYKLLASSPLKLTSETVPRTVQVSPMNFSGEISRDIEMEVGHLQDHSHKELSSGINGNLDLPGATLETNVKFSENTAGSEDVNSRDNNKATVDSSLDELPSVAKKRKFVPVENDSVTVKKRKVENKREISVDAAGKISSRIQTAKEDVSGELYDLLSSDANGTLLSGAQKASQSEPNAERSDKIETDEVHVELALNNDPTVMLSERCNPLDQAEAKVPNEESIPLPNFSVISTPRAVVDSVETGKKKKRKKKKAPGIRAFSTGKGTAGPVSSTVTDLAPKDHTDDKIDDDGRMLSYHEADQNNRVENERELSDSHDPQEQPSESFQPSDQVVVQETNKVSILSLIVPGLDKVAEAGSSGTVKRREKKKAKKSAAKVQDKSDVENLHGTSLPVGGLVLDEEMNDEPSKKNKIVPHNETEGKKPLDSDGETMKEKEASFVDSEAGKSGKSHEKNSVREPPTINDEFSSMEHSNPVNVTPAKQSEGERGLPLKNGQEVISSKASRILDFGEATTDEMVSGFAAEPLNDEDGLKAGKSDGGKKKKRRKKGATSTCESPAKLFAGEAHGNQSILSHTEVKETSKGEPMNASGTNRGNQVGESKKIVSPLAENNGIRENTKDLEENEGEVRIDGGMDTDALQKQPVEVQDNKVEHLEQEDAADEKQEAAGKLKIKAKKKTKKNQNAAAETQNNSRTKEQNIGFEGLAVPKLLEKNAGTESKDSNPRQLPNGDHTLENDLESRPESMTNIENGLETSTAGDERIDFRRYFVPEEHQIEDTSAEKVKEALHSTQAKRKTKKSNKSNANNYLVEASSPNAKENEDVSNKETSKASGNVVKGSKSRDAGKVKTPSNAKNSVAGDGSGFSKTIPSVLENNGPRTASSSSSSAKSFKKPLQDTSSRKQRSGFNIDTSARKLITKNDGNIVNGSQQRKSLLNSAGAIFSDSSSESARNENGAESSDASTRTPSDSSSSSGHSVGERELGSEDEIRSDSGRKSTLVSKFPDPKDMSIDMILRSSKRFKKAKITASQSQDPDTESQLVDFVPETQAD